MFVLVDRGHKDKAYHGRIPRKLTESITGGGSLPWVAVSDPSATRPIMAFTAKGNNSKSVEKKARELKKKLRADPSLLTPASGADPSHGGTSAGDDEDSASVGDLIAETREWTNSAGKTIKAGVVTVDALQVTFRMTNGKVVKYPLHKLSEESQAKLSEYQ